MIGAACCRFAGGQKNQSSPKACLQPSSPLSLHYSGGSSMTQLLKDLKERLDWLVAVPESTAARTDVRMLLDDIERML
jgi:hypothetical protein